MMPLSQSGPVYRGTARIKLASLCCNWNDSEQDEKKEKIRKLSKILEVLPDYARSRYHVSAVIDDDLLETAIEISRTSHAALLSSHDRLVELDIPLSKTIECVAGRSILEAAKETNKEWWVVKLYSRKGMNESSVQRLRAENNNSPRDSLGWIFRQILISKSQKDQTLEEHWKSVLSKHERRCLTYVTSGKLRNEFQALLVIPGLWHQTPFGNMHKIMAMKCVEVVRLTSTAQESSHYLDQILRIFTGFVRGQLQLLRNIDRYTVAALEGKCPGLSKHDRRQLESPLETGRLLPGASSEQRQLFFDAVCNFKRRIPSLSTFFNDMSYLGGCARYIKHLVKVERDSTVRQSLRYIFQGDENSACVIQSTDKNFHKLPVSTVEEQFDIAQRQLWLCAMRKSLASPVVPKSQQALLAKSKRPSEDRITLTQLALVAQSLGFHSSQIYQLA
ncbi:uncharacterized protein PgNI_12511, partial [Pyricularia grisea]|uniref:Uncharacterized protein n=1 Tax=Pyricularia grisea TaxID=148305 RepID=A0A6P8AMB1_PYRGI